MATEKTPRVRFAPSPTGTLHTGGARTALFNYLFGKQRGGKYILRIDDTDRERSTKDYEKDIIEGLKWLGLTHDELYYQSERTEIYRSNLKKLLDEDKVYISQEKVEKEGDRPEVIRFRNPNKKVKFNDLIKGEIEFDTTELGDFVVAKDLETPLYHFASIVDDADLGITHVIRGEDHISNTPRQILMWEALGAPIPEFAHLPMILAPDKSKLSKRKHASIASLNEFIKNGYLPEAVLNFVALLGWSPQSIQDKGEVNPNEEVLSLDDLLRLFDLGKVGKSGAIFNIEKLNWLNKQYILRLSPEKQAEHVLFHLPINLPGYNVETAEKLVPIILERISYFGQVKEMAEASELSYFFAQPEINKELLKNQDHFGNLISLIEALPEDGFTLEKIKNAVWDYATEKGRGEVLWPMRVALSGKKQSPDPFTIAAILGKEETLKRLANARDL